MPLRVALGWSSMWPLVHACVRETPSGLGEAGPEPRTLRRRLPLTRHEAMAAARGDRSGEGTTTSPSTSLPRARGNGSECPVCPPCPIIYIRDKGSCEATDVVLMTMVAVVVALLIALLLTTYLRNRRKAARSADAAGAAPGGEGKKKRQRPFGSLWHRSIASIRGGSDRSTKSDRRLLQHTQWEDVSEKEVPAVPSADKYDGQMKKMGDQTGAVRKQPRAVTTESESQIAATEPDPNDDSGGADSEMFPTTTEVTESSATSTGRSGPSALLRTPTHEAAASGVDAARRRSADVTGTSPYVDPRGHFRPGASRRGMGTNAPTSLYTAATRRGVTRGGPGELPQKYPPIAHDSEAQELLRRMSGERRSSVSRDANRATVIPVGEMEPRTSQQ